MLATKFFLFTILFIGLNAIPIEVENLKISPELTEELVKNKLNKNLFLSELTDLELNKAIADLRKEQILNELFNQDMSMNDDSNNIENLMGQYKHEKRSSLKNHHKMAYSSMLGKLNHSGK